MAFVRGRAFFILTALLLAVIPFLLAFAPLNGLFPIGTDPQSVDLQGVPGGIPNSKLRAGPGLGEHNAPWSWHMDPEDFHLADFTIEVCDGTPSFVEAELAYWLETVGRYCPWGAELASITDYR